MASINLTLPDDTLEIIERERASTGETQSEFLIRALQSFLKQQKEAEIVAQYKRGYELYPETDEEMAWIEAAQRDAFPADYWDDEYKSGEYVQ